MKLIQLRFDEKLSDRINKIADYRNMTVTSLLTAYITDCLIKDEILYQQLFEQAMRTHTSHSTSDSSKLIL